MFSMKIQRCISVCFTFFCKIKNYSRTFVTAKNNDTLIWLSYTRVQLKFLKENFRIQKFFLYHKLTGQKERILVTFQFPIK